MPAFLAGPALAERRDRHAARRLRDPAGRALRGAPAAGRPDAEQDPGPDRHPAREVRRRRLGRLQEPDAAPRVKKIGSSPRRIRDHCGASVDRATTAARAPSRSRSGDSFRPTQPATRPARPAPRGTPRAPTAAPRPCLRASGAPSLSAFSRAASGSRTSIGAAASRRRRRRSASRPRPRGSGPGSAARRRGCRRACPRMRCGSFWRAVHRDLPGAVPDRRVGVARQQRLGVGAEVDALGRRQASG